VESPLVEHRRDAGYEQRQKRHGSLLVTVGRLGEEMLQGRLDLGKPLFDVD
jgi:hypothetical protein